MGTVHKFPTARIEATVYLVGERVELEENRLREEVYSYRKDVSIRIHDCAFAIGKKLWTDGHPVAAAIRRAKEFIDNSMGAA